MEINTLNYFKDEVNCDSCNSRKEPSLIKINKNIQLFMCDKCLQELNRKIVEYLAEKHL